MKSRRHEIGLNDLVYSDRKVLENKITENVKDLFEKQMRQTMISSIELSMMILNKYFNFDQEQLLIFMAMFKMEYPSENEAVTVHQLREKHREKLKEIIGDEDIVEKFMSVQFKGPVITLV